MSRTPQSVFDALAAAKARRMADEAERVALAEHDDDVGGELVERDDSPDRCPSCGATSGICGPPDSAYCDDRWHR